MLCLPTQVAFVLTCRLLLPLFLVHAWMPPFPPPPRQDRTIQNVVYKIVRNLAKGASVVAVIGLGCAF